MQMSESNDLIDDFEDEEETSVELQELANKTHNQKKVDIRRLIEAKKESAALVDEHHYFMKLDLDSDSTLI
ncbi:MAG: hypothetical protein ACO2ZE_09855 [Pseudohongiellaceae bacterium]|jgi:hypothetical protein